MTEFTPVSALLGGMLIGVAAAGLLLLNGRIAGISGILGTALTSGDERGWRIAFLVGLPLGALGTSAALGGVPFHLGASPTVLVVAGLLVGAGTQIGSGCTSGHGVCGLARFSGRSLVATALFMVIAGLVVTLRFALWGPQ